MAIGIWSLQHNLLFIKIYGVAFCDLEFCMRNTRVLKYLDHEKDLGSLLLWGCVIWVLKMMSCIDDKEGQA